MKIKNFIPFEDLMDNLKNVPMLMDENIKPYKNARIRLVEMDPNDLNLSTLYYLIGNIEFQKKFRKELLWEGYNSLKIGWLLTFDWDDGKEYSLMPPVVEVVEREINIIPREWEIDHSSKILKVKIPLLLDWFHRAFVAKEFWEKLQVIYVENVDPTCPSYAHPNSWDEVVACDEVPSNPVLKKHYVLLNPKALYKNFWVLVHSHIRN